MEPVYGQPVEKREGMLQRVVDKGPYFLGVGMAQPHVTDAERMVTLVGMVLHVTLWSAIFGMDTDLFANEFADPNNVTLHFLHLITWSTLVGAAVLVLLSVLIHIATAVYDLGFSFNDGHLPAFLSTLILGCARVTLEFSKFSLFYFFFITDYHNTHAVSAKARNMLIAQVVLKQIAVSFTANAHRFAVRSNEPGVTFVKME